MVAHLCEKKRQSLIQKYCLLEDFHQEIERILQSLEANKTRNLYWVITLTHSSRSRKRTLHTNILCPHS